MEDIYREMEMEHELDSEDLDKLDELRRRRMKVDEIERCTAVLRRILERDAAAGK